MPNPRSTGERRERGRLVLLSAGVLVALAIVAFAAWPRGGANVEARGVIDDWKPASGEPAPDFELVDVHDPGTTHRLSDYRGKTVILNWYASWCGPCRVELPSFEEAYQEFDGEVVVLAVNLQESPDEAAGILDETGATFPAVLDADGEVARHYGVRGMPTTFFIDRDGIVRTFGAGMITEETLNEELARLGHVRGGE